MDRSRSWSLSAPTPLHAPLPLPPVTMVMAAEAEQSTSSADFLCVWSATSFSAASCKWPPDIDPVTVSRLPSDPSFSSPLHIIVSNLQRSSFRLLHCVRNPEAPFLLMANIFCFDLSALLARVSASMSTKKSSC